MAFLLDGKTDEEQQTQQHDETSSVGVGGGCGTNDGGGVEIKCFSDVVKDDILHFQIIRLQKQIYAWIGCNSAKFGHLYAAAPTRPSNAVSVTSLIGGSSDNVGSAIARRIVLKTGLNVVLACNLPKNSPLLEAAAERKLVEKLVTLGYTKSKSGVSSSTQHA